MSSPYDVIDELLAGEDLALAHTPDCEAEAEALLKEPGFDDPLLTDWRDLPFVTMDNVGSRDLDQALLVEREAGNYRLRYALADASWYVRPGTALFGEALKRGATFYTPALAVPMLPRKLSEGLISLNPLVPRRALVFDMRIAADGSLSSTAVIRALITSQAQLSYAGVQDFLDGSPVSTPGTPAAGADYLPSLRLLAELGEVLIEVAAERDVVPFNRRETSLAIVDAADGKPAHFMATARERLLVERYNEQLSLLCNQQGARLLETLGGEGSDLQGIYRVHDAPSSQSQRELRKRLDQLADSLGLDRRWYWQADDSLAAYISGLPDSPDARRRRQAVERQILLTWTASEFRAEPGRHHALAADSYARFSSPMREIAGIFTHKELLEAIAPTVAPARGSTVAPTLASTGTLPDDNELREQVIDAANRSRQTQKRLDKAIGFHVIDQLLRADLSLPMADRPARPATLVGIRDDRLYLALDALSIDLKLSIEDLEADQATSYTLTDIAVLADDSARPSWYLGDAVSVSALGFDDEDQRFVLGLDRQGDRTGIGHHSRSRQACHLLRYCRTPSRHGMPSVPPAGCHR